MSSLSTLTDQAYWAGLTGGVPLPVLVSSASQPDEHALHLRHCGGLRGANLLEIGCAPGRWMAYFAREFGCRVTGVEYVADGAALTAENLRLLDVPGHVLHADFFHLDPPPERYEVVFSRGFIEHFTDTAAVLRRMARFVGPLGLVINTIPNLFGFNGALRKRFDPEGFATHIRMTPGELARVHESAGFTTIFCDYCGIPSVVVPHKVRAARLAALVSPFVRLTNRLSKEVVMRTHLVARFRAASPTILYIGRLQP